MQTKSNTILITGGSSGIGLELANVLVQKGNKVIICSRSQEKLEKARQVIPTVNIIQCDVSQLQECERLYRWVESYHPECNILINNAAVVHKTSFRNDNDIIAKSECEIHTNFLGPLSLIKLFLPLLEKNNNSEIINVTTGLIYAPKATYTTYCATKAALHSFTQTLRIQLKDNPVKIREVIMTVVDTPFHNGDAPKIAVTPKEAVSEMVKKLEQSKTEIRIGGTKLLYILSRLMPGLATKIINRV